MMWMRRSLIAALFWMLPAVGSLWAENLLLVSVDTLRADRLSCYGYPGNRTPAIDRWAAEGVLFERAYAEVPLTLPSHASLLTGTTPLRHGVRDNTGFVLPESRLTLAEQLRQAGFETGAFISAYVLASRFGLAQGFETYDESFPAPVDGLMSTNSLRRDGRDTTQRLLEWLEGRGERPFFAWLHLYDPHTPYRGSYDQEVSRVDASIQAIDQQLRRLHLLERTHIVLVADHGEGLGEHDESTHGLLIYDSTLRVPWIIRPAGGFEPGVERVRQAFSLIDVMPTVLQLLGLEVPPGIEGRSALRSLTGREERPRGLYAESLMAQLQFGWSPLRSWRTDRYKFIEAPRPELYDLQQDPGETRNLYSEDQALAARLRQELERLLGRHSAASDSDSATVLLAEDAERLAALGYVALGASPHPRQGGGADPKDRIQVFELYQRVLGALHEPVTPQLFVQIEEIRRLDPQTRGLDYLEGLARERAGQVTAARDLYRAALEQDPENNLARGNLARLYLGLQQYGEAEATYRELLRRDPSDYRSRNNLGLLMRLDGRPEEAQQEFQEVTRQTPDYAPGWVNLGIGLAQRGELAEAEKALRRGLRLDGESAAAFFHLGRVLLAAGRPEEAREYLQTAARLDPRFQR